MDEYTALNDTNMPTMDIKQDRIPRNKAQIEVEQTVKEVGSIPTLNVSRSGSIGAMVYIMQQLYNSTSLWLMLNV